MFSMFSILLFYKGSGEKFTKLCKTLSLNIEEEKRQLCQTSSSDLNQFVLHKL